MTDLLLNAKGRIAKHRFWQGMIILTVASVIVTAGAVKLGMIFGILSYLLIYPYICVYGKRLHDIGTTAWWVIGIWLGSFVISFIYSIFLTPFFVGPEAEKIQKEMSERLMSGDLAGFSEGAALLNKELWIMQIVTIVLVNATIALILGLLSTEPRENKHGPVPSSVSG